MDEIESNLILGMVSGVSAGVIVAISQITLSVYSQENNILLIVCVPFILLLLIMLLFPRYSKFLKSLSHSKRTKKKKATKKKIIRKSVKKRLRRKNEKPTFLNQG